MTVTSVKSEDLASRASSANSSGGQLVCAVLQSVTQPCAAIKVLEFSLGNNSPFQFLAGQYVKMHIWPSREMPDLQVGIFSLASAPSELPLIRFAVSNSANPKSLRRYLFNQAAPGDQLGIEQTGYGSCGLCPGMVQPTAPVCLLGGGTGVSTLRSVMQELTTTRHTSQITLIHSVKNSEDILFREYFEHISQTQSNVSVVHTVTQPDEHWSGRTGRINAQLLQPLATSATLFFVTGSDAFVTSVVSILLELGVWPPHIRSDYAPPLPQKKWNLPKVDACTDNNGVVKHQAGTDDMTTKTAPPSHSTTYAAAHNNSISLDSFRKRRTRKSQDLSHSAPSTQKKEIPSHLQHRQHHVAPAGTFAQQASRVPPGMLIKLGSPGIVGQGMLVRPGSASRNILERSGAKDGRSKKRGHSNHTHSYGSMFRD